MISDDMEITEAKQEWNNKFWAHEVSASVESLEPVATERALANVLFALIFRSDF